MLRLRLLYFHRVYSITSRLCVRVSPILKQTLDRLHIGFNRSCRALSSITSEEPATRIDMRYCVTRIE